jgi:hypothetical protein
MERESVSSLERKIHVVIVILFAVKDGPKLHRYIKISTRNSTMDKETTLE